MRSGGHSARGIEVVGEFESVMPTNTVALQKPPLFLPFYILLLLLHSSHHFWSEVYDMSERQTCGVHKRAAQVVDGC